MIYFTTSFGRSVEKDEAGVPSRRSCCGERLALFWGPTHALVPRLGPINCCRFFVLCGQMNFGCSYGPKDINCPNCAICDVPVQLGEKLVVDRKTIHIACFKCAICGSKLRVGECALDEALARYGPVWFCHFHHMVPPKEKEEQMLKNGHYKWRAKK